MYEAKCSDINTIPMPVLTTLKLSNLARILQKVQQKLQKYKRNKSEHNYFANYGFPRKIEN